jgi:predicted metal-dependent peptidase
MAVLTDAAEALKIAKITMMMQKNTSFYTSILFSLKQTFTEELPTAATDGKELLINPEFFWDLPANQRIALLAHEVLHVALDHMHRRGKRDPKLWNVAADYVINDALAQAYYTLPAGALLDSKYRNMSTVQVYNLLDKKTDQEKQQLTGNCAMDIQYPTGDADTDVTEESVNDIIMRATSQAKMMGQAPGSVPGEIDIMLQNTLSPPLPWYTILQNFLVSYSKDDYTFRKPNKRFMPHYYLPTAYSEAICDLAICVDTSSSVTDGEFNDFITKIAEIQRVMNPKKITVVSFDTAIKNVQTVDAGENPFKKLKFKGRGGTRISPVHKWIAENKPTVTIVFTDGEFSQSAPADRSLPLVWLIYNNPSWKSEHHQRVIHYNIK